MAQKPQAPSAGFDFNVGKAKQAFSWSSESVEQLMFAIEEGYKPASTPFYEGNPNLRKGNIVFNYTSAEIKEIKKCAKDIVYFANTYCTVMTDHGLQTINLRPYQEDMLRQFQAERFNVCLASRQVGKTICSSIFIAWYSLFNFDKNSLILSNKGATTREIIDKGKTILEHLPFFLKPGTLKWDVFNSKFDNGCRIIGQTTTKKAAIGFTIHLLFMDEFAHIPANFVDTFYENVYPTVSASTNSKVIITSTPNGFNKFYDIYTAADKGLSEYTPFRVDWWDVPGRDDEWKKQTIANTSELQFNQEFGNTFHGTGNTLISGDTLLALKAQNPIFTQNNVKVYVKPEENHNYMCFVDVAKGRGMDYSTFNIINVSTQPFQQVAVYRDNMISPLLLPDIIYKYAKTYNDAHVVIESNDQGSVVCNGLYYDLEYENMFVESTVKRGAIGATMTRRVKRIGCSNIKDLIEQRKINIVDANTIVEMSTFVAKGQSFEASLSNHDDLMMNLVLFGWFTTTDIFLGMTDIEMKKMLYNEQLKAIQDDVIPFGFVNDDPEKPKYEVDEDGQVWFETPNGRHDGVF